MSEWHKQYYQKNKEKLSAVNRAWAKANPEKSNFYRNKCRYKKKYGIDITQLPPKPELCSVCQRHDTIVMDHCHIAMKFRGWLCRKCNTTLGLINDDPIILEKLINYLRKHSAD